MAIHRVLYYLSISMEGWLERKILVGKGGQATRKTAALRWLPKKLIQELEELHKEYTEAGVSASKAEKGLQLLHS